MRFRQLTLPLVAVAALSTMAGWLARRSLPQLSGDLKLPGLLGQVEIFRDDWGVPHIYAGWEEDAFFAQGFVHAQDRLWQMELQRRAATGRLSELFGKRTLAADRLLRRLGFHRSAMAEVERLTDGPPLAALRAYCRGVNVAIQQMRLLPPEFLLLRHTPEPWSLVDTLSWGRLMAWRLSSNWDSELMRYRLASRLSLRQLADIEPLYPAGQPLTTPAGAFAGEPIGDLERTLAELLPFSAGAASNAWAVAGSRTVSGRPILASDPHLGPQMPSVWYEVHLEAPGLRVAGVSLPGMPGVMIGHNDRISWGITASMVDVQDLYAERLSPDNPNQYQRGKEWREGTVVREEIRIKGQPAPRIEEVLVTHHGPVVGPAFGIDNPPLVLSSTSIQTTNSFEGVLALNKAQSWDQFRSALTKWEAPCLNFVYADVEGNIGYQLAGKVPVRGKGNGMLPAPGWDPSYDWAGFIPFDEMPNSFNPPDGIIVSANNKIVDDDYPYLLSHEWVDGYRAGRLTEALADAKRVDVDSAAKLQLDLLSLPGRELVKLIEDLLGERPVNSPTLDLLRTWDFQVRSDSAGAAAYGALRPELVRELYEPKLGIDAKYYLGARIHQLAPASMVLSRLTGSLLRILGRPASEWLGEGNDSWRTAIVRALSRSDSYLRSRLGADSKQWSWGRLHRLTFKHALGEVFPLNRIFNRGPFPLGGDVDTVAQAAPDFTNDFAADLWTVSYRQIIDLSNFDLSKSIIQTGQSGHPFSRHYFDQGPLWLKGEYHPMLFSRMTVLTHARHLLKLSPA